MPSRLPKPHARWLFDVALHAIFACSCVAGFALLARSVQAKPAVVDNDGVNPHPVELRLPADAPLSAMAQLGKSLFFDPMLSGSGQQSCASCHSPAYGYNPPNTLTVQPGGAHMHRAGYRPPPSLSYLYRQLPFSIGPDAADVDTPVNLDAAAASARNDPRAKKTAGSAPAAVQMVPQGGFFWDGRADSLQRQAYLPLLNPVEMANSDIAGIARKLARSRYRRTFVQLFGAGVLDDPRQLVSEAMFAIGRFEIEDSSFHSFSSKYDAWLQGRARLSPAEMRGLALFDDPAKGNCAGCHLSQPTADGLPPLFTDSQYEALGVPRNPALASNADARFFDLGLCGPFRVDLARQVQYCGMFLTPTLRNVDRRAVFFHNGVYRSLEQVLRFYDLRSVQPEKIYPRGADGRVQVYDDLPHAYRANIDTTDFPFGLRVGDAAPLDERDIRDIIAFLHTLDDGYTGTTMTPASAMATEGRSNSSK